METALDYLGGSSEITTILKIGRREQKRSELEKRNVMMEMGQRDVIFLVLKMEKGSQEPRNVAS